MLEFPSVQESSQKERMDVIFPIILLLKNLVMLIVMSGQSQAERSLKRQMNFRKIKHHGGDPLAPEDIISSHAVHSQLECSLKCLQKSTCVGYNYRPKSNKYAVNCQLSNKTQERKSGESGEWSFYQDLETLLILNDEKHESKMKVHYLDSTKSCKELYKMMPQLSNAYYKMNKSLEAYCDLSNNGWTLIARFSNGDSKQWMTNGSFWYDKVTSFGEVGSPSKNTDMISTAFWQVKGDEFKITRSDDSSHTALLQTTSNCLQGGTFRSKITSYGNFRNGAVWANDQCRGSCPIFYSGQYKTTAGFEKYSCSSGIQSSNYIGFWCDWDGGDGAVMMIGGGGSGCARADHGIGITEENAAKFGGSLPYYDFGYEADNNPPSSYSLNLWVR